MAAAPPRGAAWMFKPPKVLSKLASKVQVFTDTSHISAFVGPEESDAAPPWTPDQARTAANLIQEASEDDERIKDGIEFRFMVGGVACKGVEAYRKLIAAAATVAAFKTALKSHPSEHGAAPWNTLATECASRNGGLIKGPAGAIVGASRDETYEAAAQCAIAAFECGGPHGLSLENCTPLLALCQKAGIRCPLDTQKIKLAMATKTVENAAETARELGAGAEDVAALATALANVQTWISAVDVTDEPHLAPEALADISAMADAVKMHHAPEYLAATKVAEAARASFMSSA